MGDVAITHWGCASATARASVQHLVKRGELACGSGLSVNTTHLHVPSGHQQLDLIR